MVTCAANHSKLGCFCVGIKMRFLYLFVVSYLGTIGKTGQYKIGRILRRTDGFGFFFHNKKSRLGAWLPCFGRQLKKVHNKNTLALSTITIIRTITKTTIAIVTIITKG